MSQSTIRIALLAALCLWASPVRGEVVSETFGPASAANSTHPGKLTIAPGTGGTVVAADLSAIPPEAKVCRASLATRLAIEAGRGKLPWGTGLYVHTTAAARGGPLAEGGAFGPGLAASPEKEGTFYYAVVTILNGRANLKEISASNAPAEPVIEKSSPIPIPVLQLDKVAATSPPRSSCARGTSTGSRFPRPTRRASPTA